MTRERQDAASAKTGKAKRLLARDRRLNEQNTKAVLIEPMLQALGWDIHEPDEVHREFRPNSKDSPVDYALKLMLKSELFVEAKCLGENLDDRAPVTQLIKYAAVAGVEWCVLTDGDRYRIFNAAIKADADEKLFRDVRLSTNSLEDVMGTLSLLSRENLKGKKIDAIWQTEFIDRSVRATLSSLVNSGDRGLLRLIAARSHGLKPKEVAQALERLRVRFDGFEVAESAVKRLARPVPVSGSSTPGRVEKRQFKVTLEGMVRGGILRPRQQLFANYLNRRLEATLMPDGTIMFGGQVYRSCSAAGEAAKCQVSKKEKQATDGWTFWRFIDRSGVERTLADARQQFMAGGIDGWH